jgi:asparagine synthase (glutamine-hydrolysing)
MLRPFAGVLDLGDGAAGARARHALPAALRSGTGGELIDDGQLVFAARGGVGGRDGVRCVIDGTVHDADGLAAEMGLGELLEKDGVEALLAAAFRRLGSDIAERLKGEFVALLWDREMGRGLLLPDRLGIRRPFVLEDGRRLWFGSEVRDVLGMLPARPEPDPVAIAHWLSRASSPGDTTLYRGISSVPWGHLVELSRDRWQVRRYWRPEYREPEPRPAEELVEEVGAALQRAVNRRITPTDPPGVLMSGGLDSTSVAALADKISGGRAIGFAATFPDYPDIDEKPWIDVMEASGLKTVCRPTPGPGIISAGIDFLEQWSLPLHVWGDAWFQPLLNGASQHGVRTMLDGDGGDEVFGSRVYLMADLLRHGRLLGAARMARGLPEFGGRAPKRVFAELLWRYGLLGVPSGSLQVAWERASRRSRAPWWASPYCRSLVREPPPPWQAAGGPRWWSFAAYAVTEAPHAFGLLDHVRRRAEQAGLESSHPLYDSDLCELMLGVPPAECSRGTLSRPLFRQAMKGISPDEVRLRPGKSRFDRVVLDALCGPELPVIRSILSNPQRISPYVNRDEVGKLLELDRDGKPREPIGIWASNVIRLTALEIWLRSQEDPGYPARLREEAEVPAP